MTTFHNYFNKCRPDNFGNEPANKTPKATEEAIRKEYQEGANMNHIASRYKMSWSTVNRICKDISRDKAKPLSDIRVTGLLMGWGR